MILNIHGYKGNSENTMYHILKELFPDVRIVSPQIDYDKELPEDIVFALHINDLPFFSSFNDMEMQDERIDMVVGTGLGGFFATALSCRLFKMFCSPIPTILFNPCLLPWRDLPKIGFEGTVEPFETEYPTMFAKICRTTIYDQWAHNACIITGRYDKVIDHEFCKNMFTYKSQPKFLLNSINCGHSASDNPAAIKRIKKIVNGFIQYSDSYNTNMYSQGID